MSLSMQYEKTIIFICRCPYLTKKAMVLVLVCGVFILILTFCTPAPNKVFL
jgi:hypothetical protein